MSGIDLSRIVAIDTHVHAEIPLDLPDAELADNAPWKRPTVRDVVEHYRARDMMCVVFPVDGELRGLTTVSNEEIAEAGAEHPDILIPFGSVDPARDGAARIVRRLVEHHGIRGFKFHPGLQEFYPNDSRAYALYAEMEQLGVPAVFHTGQAAGGNIRLKYCDPLYLDDVAVDFPDLRIVMAHPSFPWQDVALSIASRRAHVYIDLSGWSPKYFPPQLVQYANTLLKEKVLFGSDFPVITPERWLADFAGAPFRDEVRPGILKHNAARLLGLKERE